MRSLQLLFSFISPAEIISLLGAKPVFVDIDPRTYNLDSSKIEKAISKRTKCIMPVSLYGQCAEFEKINDIAKKFGLPVIEDGAQSFGALTNGKKSCSLSTIGCTSFFPSKPLGVYGDGGACFTNDDQLNQKLKWVRVHGQDKRYHHAVLGTNGRFDTLQAAVLIAKLKLFPSEVEKRNEIGSYYSKNLEGVVGVPEVLPGNTHVYAQYTIQVSNRGEFQKQLQSLGIPTAIHYPTPLHLQPAFSKLGHKNGEFPVSEKVSKKVISLPMHPYLKRGDQDKIISDIKEST